MVAKILKIAQSSHILYEKKWVKDALFRILLVFLAFISYFCSSIKL